MLFSRNIFFVSGLSSKKTYFLFQCFFGQKKLVCPLKMIYKRRLWESSSSILLESCWEEECDRVAYWRLPVFMRWTTWSTGIRLKQYSICNRFFMKKVSRKQVYIVPPIKYVFHTQSPTKSFTVKARALLTDPCGCMRQKNYHSSQKFILFFKPKKYVVNTLLNR